MYLRFFGGGSEAVASGALRTRLFVEPRGRPRGRPRAGRRGVDGSGAMDQSDATCLVDEIEMNSVGKVADHRVEMVKRGVTRGRRDSLLFI